MSWKQLINIYYELGIPTAHGWIICLGPNDNQYKLYVMPTSEEKLVYERLECCCLPKSCETHMYEGLKWVLTKV